MIVAHFFVRKVKKKPFLFVETTSSNGLVQPAPAAQKLMPLEETDNRQKWIRDAYYEFIKLYPDLVLLDSLNNYMRLESDHPSFDLVFRPKPKRKRNQKKDEGLTDEDIDHLEKLKDTIDDFGEFVNSVEAKS